MENVNDNFKYPYKDIFNRISETVYPRYKNLPIIPSSHAQEEIDNLGVTLDSVKFILEYGFDCFHSKRKANILERCILHKGKTLKVVVALVEWKNETFWRLVHVGKISRHKFG